MIRVSPAGYTKTAWQLTVIFILFSVFPVVAQDYLDLARFSYAITPKNDYKNGEGGYGIDEWNLQLDAPIVLNDKSAFIAGFTGIGTSLGLAPEIEGRTKLYSLAMRLGLNQKYSETWSGTYVFIPKVSSDLSAGLREGLQLGFAALINKTRSVRLKYTFGIYANTEEYGLLVVPLVGGYYLSPNDRFEATLLLPSVADFNYQVSQKLRLGVNFDGLGSTFTIHSQAFGPSYVTKGSNELFLYARLPISKSIYLNLKAGYALFRSYRIFDRDDKVDLSIASIYLGDNRTQLNTEFRENFIFKFDLVYRYHLNKKAAPSDQQ